MLNLLDGNVSVVGLQWGDEGKGKIVDFLAERANLVVRWCGGANAGHSVKIAGKKLATHLLPVGVFHPGVVNLIANGVVLDPHGLFDEIDGLAKVGVEITPRNLRVSYKAHLVMPWHKAEDAAREGLAGEGNLGTTRRGIGPAYADKALRLPAIRVGDLEDLVELRARLDELVPMKKKQLAALGYEFKLTPEQVFAELEPVAKRLLPFIDDTSRAVFDGVAAGKSILFEGAHAALLDVDHGTYPFVTSSSCSALGLCSGAGVPPHLIRHHLGIMKAYCTRVGAGPMPTEFENETAKQIRDRGDEYGSTTRRPRRIGWFDAVATRYSAQMCGVNHICLTMLDVLGQLDEIQVCTAYRHGGRKDTWFRSEKCYLNEVKPETESLPGWKCELAGISSYDKLPENARRYVDRIEQLIGCPIHLVSIGPERHSTLWRESRLKDAHA